MNPIKTWASCALIFWCVLAVMSPLKPVSASDDIHTLSANLVENALVSRTLNLPLPSGDLLLRLKPNPILSTKLQAQFPQFATWRLKSDDPRFISGRAENGLNGFVLTVETQEQQWHIHSNKVSGMYQLTPLRPDLNRLSTHRCDVENPNHALKSSIRSGKPTATHENMWSENQEPILNYRIAISATGEYAEYHAQKAGIALTQDNHALIQQAGLSAILQTLNRVNEVTERDLGIRLTLVSGIDQVYPDPARDPFMEPIRSYQSLEKNQALLDQALGNKNYDLGHIFHTNSGGTAVVGSVCNSSNKAMGLSGDPTPEGDRFDIQVVAHEIGHQLGANHSFSGKSGACGSTNFDPLSAVEPGSGSTIMAYAGLCGSDNQQSFSDAMFHSNSITEIRYHTRRGEGSRCAIPTENLNLSAPIVDAGQEQYIPINTPFTLTGSATDADGDTMTHSWENTDVGTQVHLGENTGNNSLFRAMLPKTSRSRTFPNWDDLTTNAKTRGEDLSAIARNIHFRLVARDGNGAVGADAMVLRVIDTGQAFSVTQPTSTDLVGGSTMTVRWTVAGTDQPPISCNTVSLDITDDGAKSFQALAKQVPNNGSAEITLPKELNTPSQIRVQCDNRPFFALSGWHIPSQAIASVAADIENQAIAEETAASNQVSDDSGDTSAGATGGGGMTAWWQIALLILLGAHLIGTGRGTKDD